MTDFPTLSFLSTREFLTVLLLKPGRTEKGTTVLRGASSHFSALAIKGLNLDWESTYR